MPKIYLKPTGLHSRAMLRVANALRESLPRGFEEVHSLNDLGPNDIQVLHVISHDAIEYAAKLKHRYVVVQYCLKTAGGDLLAWNKMWARALFVWSYYDLVAADAIPAPGSFVRFYHAPLGIDKAFAQWQPQPKQNYIITTGYVSGPGAEAITDAWQAAKQAGVSHVVHIGPKQSPEPLPVQYYTNISDEHLAMLYAQARYVCSMRYVEGFEMPAIEGLACYTRPIVFDQPDMRHWYFDHAVLVDECQGPDLVRVLVNVFKSNYPERVTDLERSDVVARFNWQTIMQGFWEGVDI